MRVEGLLAGFGLQGLRFGIRWGSGLEAHKNQRSKSLEKGFTYLLPGTVGISAVVVRLKMGLRVRSAVKLGDHELCIVFAQHCSSQGSYKCQTLVGQL